jgi:AraC-like DNA-binding protein
MARGAPAPDWATLALDAGYFDQSHLIRDFAAFAGVTPAQFVAQYERLEREGAYIKRNHLPLAA